MMYYGNGFLSRGFTDQREILHGSSATSRTGLLPFWRGWPQGWPSYRRQQGAYGGICFLLKHLYVFWSGRMVNSALEEEMKSIHALTQKTLTPEQWKQQQQQAAT